MITLLIYRFYSTFSYYKIAIVLGNIDILQFIIDLFVTKAYIYYFGLYIVTIC
jgi:hypothetical protein